jgi:hypothetical protein
MKQGLRKSKPAAGLLQTLIARSIRFTGPFGHHRTVGPGGINEIRHSLGLKYILTLYENPDRNAEKVLNDDMISFIFHENAEITHNPSSPPLKLRGGRVVLRAGLILRSALCTSSTI